MVIENMDPFRKKEWQHWVMMDIDGRYMSYVAAVEVVPMKNDDRKRIDKIVAILVAIVIVVAVRLKTLSSTMLMVLDRMLVELMDLIPFGVILVNDYRNIRKKGFKNNRLARLDLK